MAAADANQELIKGIQGLRTLATMLPEYNGTELISDWLSYFDLYSQDTGRTTDEQKLFDIISHLSHEVKQWFLLLPDATKKDYNALRQALVDKFSPSTPEVLQVKKKMYSAQQKPEQKFKDFVQCIQIKARKINMPDEETVKIFIHGAHPTMKPHLVMANPATVDALLKLPIVVDDMTTDVPVHQMLHVLNNKMDSLQTAHAQLKDTVAALQYHHDTSNPENTWQDFGASPPQPRINSINSHPPAGQHIQRSSKQFCGQCGKKCRGNQECPAFGKECYHCGFLHHFKHMCQSRFTERYHGR